MDILIGLLWLGIPISGFVWTAFAMMIAENVRNMDAKPHIYTSQERERERQHLQKHLESWWLYLFWPIWPIYGVYQAIQLAKKKESTDLDT